MAGALPAIPGYRPIRLLGQGGMGRVVLAEDEALGRRVAIKTIAPEAAGTGQARERFLREARAMATVEHPNVVRLYAYGEAEGQAYFVMEHVDGETLAARLRRAARLAPTEAARIAREVALALRAAWRRGIVHRDVKPGNILLDTDGHVRVTDFGLARRIEAGDISITGAHAVVGSPHYLAPEQARGEDVDFRSDLYSLGIVLFEMLAGRRPFEGRTPVDVIARQLSDPLPDLSKACPDTPPSLQRTVDWLARKDPSERPASYDAVLDALEGDVGAGDSSSAPTSTMPSFLRARRRAGARVLVAAGLVAALGVGLLLARRGPPPRPPGTLVIAVAPFSGPDDESAREGRLMAALVEREVARLLPESDAVAFGIHVVGDPVRDEAAAREAARRLAADVLVWGRSLAFPGQTEIQPRLTAQASGSRGPDPARPAQPQDVGPLVFEPRGPVEERRQGAAAIAESALRLLARQAAARGDPERARRLLERLRPAPISPSPPSGDGGVR